jgi:ABC-2 type transport system ATP-binding protein
MDEAERCDELLFLRDGRLLAQDTPGALLADTGARNLEAAFIDLAGRVTTTEKARP